MRAEHGLGIVLQSQLGLMQSNLLPHMLDLIPGCSNNTPIDLLGLYRVVVCQGGLTTNEAYDAAGRYSGTINWVRCPQRTFGACLVLHGMQRAQGAGHDCTNLVYTLLLSLPPCSHQLPFQIFP